MEPTQQKEFDDLNRLAVDFAKKYNVDLIIDIKKESVVVSIE